MLLEFNNTNNTSEPAIEVPALTAVWLLLQPDRRHPDKEYLTKGMLFHGFAEFYVTPPDHIMSDHLMSLPR